MTKPSSEPPRSGPSGPAILLVVLVLLVMVCAVWLAFAADDADDTTWQRLTYVLAAVQAVAFAGIGFYFGSAVQHARVAIVEAQLDEFARQAEAGRSLAAMILAKEGRIVESGEHHALVESRPDDIRREYADAARLLFPYELDKR